MRAGKVTLMAGASSVLMAVTLGLIGTYRGSALELTALPAVLWYALNVVVTVAYAVGRWRTQGSMAVAPLLVLLAGIPAIEGVRIAERRITDLSFGRHFQDLQSTVDRIDLVPGGIARLRPRDLPESTRACCYRAFVRRDSLDRLTAVFLVRRQLAYLYDPDGAALQRGVGRRWRHRELVAPRWYRLER